MASSIEYDEPGGAVLVAGVTYRIVFDAADPGWGANASMTLTLTDISAQVVDVTDGAAHSTPITADELRYALYHLPTPAPVGSRIQFEISSAGGDIPNTVSPGGGIFVDGDNALSYEWQPSPGRYTISKYPTPGEGLPAGEYLLAYTLSSDIPDAQVSAQIIGP